MTEVRGEAAKQPFLPLAGPYGHPFHPIFVTVPIGAWVGSLVLDIASRSVGDPGALSRGAYWMIAVGVIGALLAAVFGLLDLLAIPAGTRARKVGLTHMALNLSVVALFVVSFVVRANDGLDRATQALPLVLSVVAILLLLVSGWLGGMLAYRYGVRVADQQTQAEGFR
ncbi:MAG: DUF2231 domain-containing protein [Acidimicrobiales bacterium]